MRNTWIRLHTTKSFRSSGALPTMCSVTFLSAVSTLMLSCRCAFSAASTRCWNRPKRQCWTLRRCLMTPGSPSSGRLCARLPGRPSTIPLGLPCGIFVPVVSTSNSARTSKPTWMGSPRTSRTSWKISSFAIRSPRSPRPTR